MELSGGDLLKLFLISEGIWLVGLFVAMLVTRVSFTFPRLLAIATLPSVVFVLPLWFLAKLIIATVATYVMIVKLTDAQYYPDAVLCVGVANVLYVAIGMTLLTKLS